MQSSRTFRIFVSSTFSDLKEERNALQRNVFPKLREFCMQHGCRFQAIDLRWGISSEAGYDQQTMEICIEEIARCQKTGLKPNFVILLGNRYGWRPLPYEIHSFELGLIEDNISEPDLRFLKEWYILDENVGCGAYFLKPREGKYRKPEVWAPIERRLREILKAAVVITYGNHPDNLEKYNTSATEQEILFGALKTEKPHEHVHCFVRNFEGLSEELGVADYTDLDETGHFDKDSQACLSDLKSRLEQQLRNNYHSYTVKWNDSEQFTEYLNKLCADVYKSLSGAISKEIMGLEAIDPIDNEMAEHRKFRDKRASDFYGSDRFSTVSKINGFIYDRVASRHPLVIYGESGSGKSSLMAKAVQWSVDADQAIVIERFIGVTPGSSDSRTLLEGLCREISRKCGLDEATVPHDYRELSVEFRKRIEAVKVKRLIIFIDALDQLSITDNNRDLSWLPLDLPVHVQVVVSILPGYRQQILQSRLPESNLLKLGPMTKADGAEMLRFVLARTGRCLQPAQEKAVLDKFEISGLPLYLKLAGEEASHWRSFDGVPVLSSSIHELIKSMLNRLSAESNHGNMIVSRSLGYLAAARHGLTEDELLDLLSADDEVFREFTRRSFHTPPETMLPVVVWSRLFFDLEPYLTQRSGDGTSLLSFYHRQLREAVEKEYENDRVKMHRVLAQYFGNQTLNINKNFPNLRKVSELAYQQTYGDLKNDLEKTLTDICFIETKFKVKMGYDLLADYYRVGAINKVRPPVITARYHSGAYGVFCPMCLTWGRIKRSQLGGTISCSECGGKLALNPFVIAAEWQSLKKHRKRCTSKNRTIRKAQDVNINVSRAVLEFADFIKSQIHILTIHPNLTFQQAINQPDNSIVSFTAKAVKNKYEKTNWFEWLNKPQKKTPLLMTLKGHTNHITSCVFSPDGTRIASSSGDMTVRLWDAETGEILRTLTGHTDCVNDCVFSPDGKKVASASNDWSVRVWDAETGEELHILTSHNSAETCIFSPDGKYIASASMDDSVRVWDADTGEELYILTGHTWGISCVFSPDSKRIASVSRDGCVRVWDAVTGKQLRALKCDKYGAFICFSPDGKHMACASGESVRLWDINTGEELRVLHTYGRGVLSCEFSPDGKRIASGSIDDSVRLWDVETGEELRALKGHKHGACLFGFSPDGKRISSASGESVRLWDVETGEELSRLTGHIKDVDHCVFSPDGTRIVTASSDLSIRLWDAESSGELTTLTFISKLVHSCAFSNSGKHIVSASWDKSLSVWDTETGIELKTLIGHRGMVESCVFSPSGKLVASASDDRTVRLWDIETGEELRTLEGHKERVETCVFSPDGKLIASASRDGSVRLWDVETGDEQKMLIGYHAAVSCVFSPDGKRIASAGDRAVRIWDAETGKELRTLTGHTKLVTSCVFSPDGTRIASSSGDGQVRVWDAETGEELRTLSGHTDWVYNCVFSPDGKKVASAPHDGFVRVWDVETGEELKTLTGHTSKVVSCLFSSDGKYIISASKDMSVRVWDTSNWELLYTFIADRPLVCLNISIRGVVIGDDGGTTYVLKMHGASQDIPITTPIRQYLFNHHHWEKCVTVACPWCGKRFPVNQDSLTYILSSYGRQHSNISQNTIKAANADSILVTSCLYCHKKLKLAPFLVDNARCQ